MKKIPKSTKLSCAFCQGRGIQPGAKSLSCIVCKGRGRFTVKQPYHICKECGGAGKKKGATLYCLPCHGKGFVEESRRHPLAAEFPISKTRRKRSKKSVKFPPPAQGGHSKADSPRAKKIKKSFFKGLLRTFKIL